MEPLEKLASRISATKILVLGDLMANKVIWGDQLRLGKEAPVPVMRRAREQYEMAGAARVSRAVKKLGAEVFLCGIVGFDDAAFSLRQAITGAGIGTGGLFPSDARPTTVKTHLMSQEHEQLLFRLDTESNAPLTESEIASIRGYVDAMLGEVDALVLCDYQKGMFGTPSFARWLVDTAAQRGVKTVVQSQPPGLGSFAVVSLAASAREFMYLRGRGFPTDLRGSGQEMRELLHCASLVVIYEAGGLSEWSPEGESLFFPGPMVRPPALPELEEAVTSVLAAGVAAGVDRQESMQLGAAAAAVVAGKTDAEPVTLDELRSACSAYQPPEER
jgi:rfaE bifunctional protein kinase chain/domain